MRETKNKLHLMLARWSINLQISIETLPTYWPALVDLTRLSKKTHEKATNEEERNRKKRTVLLALWCPYKIQSPFKDQQAKQRESSESTWNFIKLGKNIFDFICRRVYCYMLLGFFLFSCFVCF